MDDLNTNKILRFLKLNNGIMIPSIGMGTYAIPNLDDVIYESIKAGLRMIDTASYYKNEKEVGIGVNRAINDRLVTRDELFIITKLWPTDKHRFEECFEIQLKTLNIDYIDLYLDHWPITIIKVGEEIKKTPIHILWKQMEDKVKKGLIKSIGVSNYNTQALMELLSFCEIKPVVNEFEFHPYCYQKDLIEFCNKFDIKVIAYKSLCDATAKDFSNNTEIKLKLLDESIIKEISKKHNKTPGQIALNWGLSQGVIVIPSSTKRERFSENIGSLDFKLSDEEICQIGKLHKGYRICQAQFIENCDYNIFT